LTFRGVRLDQNETLALGSRFLVRAGGEYVLVGLGAPASGLRARVKLETRVTSNWYADVIYAALPNGTTPNDALNAALEGMDAPSVLSDALNQLDTFPALLMRGGRPVLESGRHEEVDAILVLQDDRPAVGAPQDLGLLSRVLQELRWRLAVFLKDHFVREQVAAIRRLGLERPQKPAAAHEPSHDATG